MTDFKEKYINPFTDYGFKRFFGEESNKDLLLDFEFDNDKKYPNKFRYYETDHPPIVGQVI